jgi:hypothetical protein
MTNLAYDQNLIFDTELSLSGASFTGTPVLIGVLQNRPVMILFKNQTNVSVFLSDTNSSTKGTTMAASEEIILDCRANNGVAVNMGFPVGTAFYATAAAGTGAFKISILYAK